LRGLGRVVWLVPLVVAAQQLAAGGVPTAEACSGGAPRAGWLNLAVADSYPLDRVSIATDGFVLFEGVFNSEQPATELPLPWVRATDEAGEEVAGHIKVLRADPQGDLTVTHLEWQPDEVLSIGTVLQLSWAGSNDGLGEGGAGSVPLGRQSIELDVVDEPTQLPTPVVTLGPWLDVRHGVGELVDCETTNSCGSQAIQVPTREVRLPGVGVSWEVPAFSGMVAWEVRAEPSEPQNGVEGPLRLPPLVGRNKSDALQAGQNGEHHVVDLGWVAFTDDATDQCVVLVLKDLRTGEESRSQPLCESPGSPEYEVADYHLASCDAPPTPGSLPLWCIGRDRDERCQDLGDGAAGEGPGGHAGAGGGDGLAVVDEPQAASRASSSDGCQIAPATGGIGVVAAALGAMLSLIARRRRAR
jgi:hypothetical protein